MYEKLNTDGEEAVKDEKQIKASQVVMIFCLRDSKQGVKTQVKLNILLEQSVQGNQGRQDYRTECKRRELLGKNTPEV